MAQCVRDLGRVLATLDKNVALCDRSQVYIMVCRVGSEKLAHCHSLPPDHTSQMALDMREVPLPMHNDQEETYAANVIGQSR